MTHEMKRRGEISASEIQTLLQGVNNYLLSAACAVAASQDTIGLFCGSKHDSFQWWSSLRPVSVETWLIEA